MQWTHKTDYGAQSGEGKVLMGTDYPRAGLLYKKLRQGS